MGGTKVRAAFVGRVPELERSAAALARTARGEGITVLCTGEAGIGKTRLVHEVAERAQDGGFAVLAGGCVEMGPAGLPYGPFAEALRGAVATGTLDPARLHPAAVDQLARLLPDFNPRGGAEVPDVDLVGLGQVRLFEAFLAAVESVRAVRPVVLIIEDIHWADRSTLDLLTFLVRNAGSAGCMILATVRTDAMERGDPLATFLAELGRWPSVERIDLRPLDLSETTEQLRDVLGADPSDDLAQRIHRRSDGNPFFIEQLAKAQVDGEPSNVPASLRDILLTQLSQQPRDVQDLLAAAAVAGPLADDSLLASILGCSSEALLGPLRAAVRARLLVPLVTDRGEVYAFRHALMAEATEADLLDGERRRLHGRCADALIPRRPDEGAALAQWAVRCAHHREGSGDVEATIAASIEAAIETATVAAHADAMEQYHRAIRLLPLTHGTRVWGDWDVSELYGRAAACAALIGEAETAAAYSRSAIEHLPADTDPWRRGQLLNAWSEHLWIAGEADFADALVEAARVIPADPPTATRASALVSLGFYHLYMAERDVARGVIEEAVTTAVAAGAPREEAMARTLLISFLIEEGDPAGSDREMTAAIAATRRMVPRPDTSVVYMNLAASIAWAGREELSIEVCREGLELARRHGFETYYGGGLVATGAEVLTSLGRLREASDLLDAIEVTPTGGYVDTARRITRALVSTHLGDLERAREEIRVASTWPEVGDVAVRLFLAMVKAEWSVETGQTHAVAGIVNSALALSLSHVPDLDMRASMCWLGVRAAADSAERARARRDAAAELGAIADGERHLADGQRLLLELPAVDGPPSPMRRRAVAYLALADAECLRLHDRADPAAWGRAVAAWDGLTMLLRPTYARIRHAEACLATGRDARADAVALLDRAHAEARTYGAERLMAMSEGIARRARVDLSAEAPGPLESEPVRAAAAAANPVDRLGLTDRETEILGLLAAGLTNRQIGERLFISPKTAGVHVSNILGKLDVGSRIQAATLAHRLGLSPDGDPASEGA